MKRIILLLFAELFISSVYSQKVIDSIKMKTSFELNISAMEFQDSLFLKIHTPAMDDKTRYFWFTEKGVIAEIDLHELNGKTIFAVTKSSQNTVYYYLNRNSKKIEISSLTLSIANNSKASSTEPVLIDGRFIGSYTDRNMHVLTFNKKEKFLLTDTEFDKDTKIKESNYPLSINLSDFKNNQIAFIPDGAYLSPRQSTALVKIYNRKDEIVILVDDPYQEYKNAESKFFLTTVVRIDKQSGKSITNSRFETRRGTFRSILWKDCIIKAIYEDYNNGIELGTIGLTNFEQRTIQHLAFEDLKKVVRLGETYRTYLATKKTRMGSDQSIFILADTLDNKLVLTLGSVFELSPQSPIPSANLIGAGTVIGLLLMNSVLKDLSWGSFVQTYTYMIGDLKGDFGYLKNPNFFQKKIDDYEIQKDESDIRFNYKGYGRLKNRTYCLYKEKRSPYIKIVTF